MLHLEMGRGSLTRPDRISLFRSRPQPRMGRGCSSPRQANLSQSRVDRSSPPSWAGPMYLSSAGLVISDGPEAGAPSPRAGQPFQRLPPSRSTQPKLTGLRCLFRTCRTGSSPHIPRVRQSELDRLQAYKTTTSTSTGSSLTDSTPTCPLLRVIPASSTRIRFPCHPQETSTRRQPEDTDRTGHVQDGRLDVATVR